MKKVVKITERDLNRLIKKILHEQSLGQSYDKGKSMGYVSGQQAQQAVKRIASDVASVGKQVAIKIGKTLVYVVLMPVAIVGGVLWLIGKGVYKVSVAVHNALIKLLSTVKGVVISAATELKEIAINTLTAAGIMLDKGLKYVSAQLKNLKDYTISIVKWIVGQMKQFGVQVYAAFLVGLGNIKEIAAQVESFLASEWKNIQAQVGMAWDKAKGYGTQIMSGIKSGVQNLAQKGKQAAGKLSDYAGRASGFLQGMLAEMFSRYLSFIGDSPIEILNEAKLYNNNKVLL